MSRRPAITAPGVLAATIVALAVAATVYVAAVIR